MSATAAGRPTILTADFTEDLRRELVSILTTWGGYFPPAAATNVDALSMIYYNLVQRWIDPQPRESKWSRELAASLPSLTPGLRSAVERIADESERGQSLIPYLSKKVQEADYDDLLMNDWGVNHMHLGARGSGVHAERTGELLFVMATNTTLHFIDVLDHKSFSDQRIVELLHLNWPDLLKPFQSRGASNLQPKLTERERSEARKAGLLTFVEVADGTIYAPPGGGISTARTSVSARTQADLLLTTVHEAEERCRTTIGQIGLLLEARLGVWPPEVRLHVKLAPVGVVVVEETTNCTVRWTPTGTPYLVGPAVT